MTEPRLPQTARVHETTVQKVAAGQVTPPIVPRRRRHRPTPMTWSKQLHPLLVDYIRAHPQYEARIINETEVLLINPPKNGETP